MSENSFPWRTPTAKIATIKKVHTKEYKGQQSLVIVLSNPKGELIDAKFKLPVDKFNTFKMKSLFAAVVGDKPTAEKMVTAWNGTLSIDLLNKTSEKLVGKQVGIQIEVREWEGKKYYDPTGYCDAGLLPSEVEGEHDQDGEIGF